MRRSVVLGSGGYLPEKVLTNADLSKMVDTSDDWITQRTGIRQRHIAADGELTSDLAAKAARQAIDDSGVPLADIDLIVVATSTPDNTFPAAAVAVQEKLGMTSRRRLRRSGGVLGLSLRSDFRRRPDQDRPGGKGAGRRCRDLLAHPRLDGSLDLRPLRRRRRRGGSRRRRGEGGNGDRGVLGARLRSDGRHKEKLYVDGGPSSTGQVGHLRMEGREVFKFAVANIADVVVEALSAAGITAADIDWFVPHQANVRIIDASAKKLGIPLDKVVRTVDLHANTSAASIPLALSVASRDGRIKRGDLILLEAMGGGFTWGAVLMRW